MFKTCAQIKENKSSTSTVAIVFSGKKLKTVGVVKIKEKVNKTKMFCFVNAMMEMINLEGYL